MNVRALPSMDDLSEMDDSMYSMCKHIATQMEETNAKKNAEEKNHLKYY